MPANDNNEDEIRELLRVVYKSEPASAEFCNNLFELLQREANREATGRHYRLWQMPFAWATVALIIIAAAVYLLQPQGGKQPVVGLPPSQPASPAVTQLPVKTNVPSPTPDSTAPPSSPVSTPAPVTNGFLVVRITDAPPKQNVKAVNVTVANVQVHRADGNESTDAGWETVVEGPAPFDLLQLRGVTALLGEKEIPIGQYTQVRFDVNFVSANVGGQQVSTGVEVPGDELRLVGAFEIKSNETTTITIDINAGDSLVFTGDGKIIFKPVAKLILN